MLNREHWTRNNARYTAARAHEAWASGEVTWGVWHVPESQMRMLPDVHGLHVIELGCGTGYFGAWLKKLGAARVVGVDITPAQLDTARAMNAVFALGLEFIEANAEDVPLPDASFDLAVSEYGASIWCDPRRWIPEAARLLRAGGELVFMRETDLQVVCSPDEDRVAESLVRPLREMHRLDWRAGGEATTEFHLSNGDLFRALRLAGFDVVDYREVYPPEGARDHDFYSYVPVEWARRWPAEEVWRARRR